MLVATGTKGIAAAQPKSTKNRIARNASAKIVKRRPKSARKLPESVVHRIGKGTRTATTKTITAHATGMVEIAVERKTTINTAKLASVWTR